MSDFADVASRALQNSSYSMKAAARAMNYDVAYLSRVLNGKRKPSAKLASSLDALGGAEGALAATVLDEDDNERVNRTFADPSRLDSRTIEALAGVLAAYRRLDDTAQPKSLIPAVMEQMKEVTLMLRDSRGPHRDKLAEVTSEWIQFSGWLFAEVRKDSEAVRLLNDALELWRQLNKTGLSGPASRRVRAGHGVERVIVEFDLV